MPRLPGLAREREVTEVRAEGSTHRHSRELLQHFWKRLRLTQALKYTKRS